MDRNERPPEQHTPEPPPSFAAQILTVAARILDMRPEAPVDRTAARDALGIATHAVTGTAPKQVREDSAWRALQAMPAADGPGTCHWYADRLRATAEAVR